MMKDLNFCTYLFALIQIEFITGLKYQTKIVSKFKVGI